MKEYNPNALTLSFDGIPVSTYDQSACSYSAEGLTFKLKPDSNFIGMLCENLGQTIPFSIEYFEEDCEGFKKMLRLVFPEGTEGILQIEKIDLSSDNPGVTFSITPV